MKKIKVLDITLVAIFAAIVAVCSIISIPLPTGVAITLQTFAIALCGFTLGRIKGVIAVVVYILLGIIGLPVFSNFNSGIGVILGPTGGFIVGFIPMVILCGEYKNKVLYYLMPYLGLAICHLLGVLQFCRFTGTGILKGFLLVSVPYIIKDVASIVLAQQVAKPVKKFLKSKE